MKQFAGAAMLLLAYTLPLRADSRVDASISMAEVFQEKLLPIREAGNTVSIPGIPAFKFFEGNNLVGLLSGALPKDKPMISAIHTLPDGFTNKILQQELTRLKLPTQTSGRTVVIFAHECAACRQVVREICKEQVKLLGAICVRR
jgi:hypothetical protein